MAYENMSAKASARRIIDFTRQLNSSQQELNVAFAKELYVQLRGPSVMLGDEVQTNRFVVKYIDAVYTPQEYDELLQEGSLEEIQYFGKYVRY